MMDFYTKNVVFVLDMVDCVLEMMILVLEMMNFVGGSSRSTPSRWYLSSQTGPLHRPRSRCRGRCRYVVDAVCYVYTCRRLIDRTTIAERVSLLPRGNDR